MGGEIAPSQAELIGEMGGAEFFDRSIADKVNDSIARNAMTPSVARDFVKDLASRRQEFLDTVTSTFQGLEGLKITDTRIEAGSADVAFLIPRDLFNNQVGTFAKELVFINLLIRDCSEATTGKVESVDLKELSSSVPTVALAPSARVVLALAKILNKFLDAWKRIEEIREVRGRLTKMGLKGVALEELTGQISTTVEEVVEESTSTLLIEYNGDSGRKNELSNALTQDMRRLFGQIERGLKIELHAEAKADEQDEVYLDD